MLIRTSGKLYGVTATPMRSDGLGKICYMLLGDIRYRYTAKDRAKEQGMEYLVYSRFTRVAYPHSQEMHINDAYMLIRDNEVHNEQIMADVKKCIAHGRTPVVLARYQEHASLLSERMQAYADKIFLLSGDKSKKELQEVRGQMEEVFADETIILVATGQMVGEGFDYPRLDILIMATPVLWKGIVEQYAGRLNRDYEGKKVYRMISLLKERQEAGVKVTVVTWHPDSYKYGKSEVRMELLELQYEFPVQRGYGR